MRNITAQKVLMTQQNNKEGTDGQTWKRFKHTIAVLKTYVQPNNFSKLFIFVSSNV